MEKQVLLTIVRHGEALQQVNRTEKANHDSHLSMLGQLQARLTGAFLRGSRPTEIVASPLNRSLETAHAIAQACDIQKVHIWEEVREGFADVFLGNELTELLCSCPSALPGSLFDIANRWTNVPDTKESFFRRCDFVLERLSVPRETTVHTVLVTHGAFANWMIQRALGIPPQERAAPWFELENGSVSQLQFFDPPLVNAPLWWLYPSLRMRVLRLNDTRHLRAMLNP